LVDHLMANSLCASAIEARREKGRWIGWGKKTAAFLRQLLPKRILLLEEKRKRTCRTRENSHAPALSREVGQQPTLNVGKENKTHSKEWGGEEIFVPKHGPPFDVSQRQVLREESKGDVYERRTLGGRGYALFPGSGATGSPSISWTQEFHATTFGWPEGVQSTQLGRGNQKVGRKKKW